MSKVVFENLRYNAATMSFEATVAMNADGTQVKYACSLHAPLDTDYDVVTTGLMADARRQKASASPLRLLRSKVPHTQTIARSPQFADNSLWSSIGAMFRKDAA